MQTKYKLALLELIGGLLGWTWIIASVAMIYFVVMAIFFQGQWSNAFWALAISAVAKWLARGFMDNQARVSFVAKLVSNGHTPQQANQEWIDRYTSRKGP